MLDQGAGAVNVQNLEAVADAQHRFAHVVGVLQQQLVDGVAASIGGGGLRITRRVVLGGIDVGFASRQQHGVAALDQLHHFGGRLIQRDSNRFSSGHCDGPFVLRQGALGILGVGGMWNGDGDAWRHRLIVARGRALVFFRRLHDSCGDRKVSVAGGYLLLSNDRYTPLPLIFWNHGVAATLPSKSLRNKDLYVKYSEIRT